jgi:type II secretory pathway pseudopilin PulG
MLPAPKKTQRLVTPVWQHESIPGPDAGSTFVEIMVVLLILAVLLAIAIPTFLGVKQSANDRAPQSI